MKAAALRSRSTARWCGGREWSATALKPGDEVEIVRAMQGG